MRQRSADRSDCLHGDAEAERSDARKQIKGRTVRNRRSQKTTGRELKSWRCCRFITFGACVNCGASLRLPRRFSQEKFGYGQGAGDGVRSASLKRQRARSAHPRKAWPPGLLVQGQKWALLSTGGTMRFGNQPHRRGVCTGALRLTAPFQYDAEGGARRSLGLLARQCQADADVEAAAAIVAPTNIATRKRLMTCPPLFYELRYCQRSAVFLTRSRQSKAASDVVQFE